MASTSTSRFLALPDEVLLYQFAFFQDLESHLAFSKICGRIYAIYDESLWRRIALSCGLGRPLDVGLRQVSWRTTCASVVHHSKSCRLSDCSERHLAKGAVSEVYDVAGHFWFTLVANNMQDVTGWELCLSSVFEGMSGDLEDLYSVAIPCNAGRISWLSRLLRKPDFLRSVSLPSLTNDCVVTKMAHHLPASCALATVPAVDRLVLDFGQVTVQVRNSDGVCVWDLVTALARKMLQVITFEPGHEDTMKAPARVYHFIAEEWRQHVLLKLSLHGRGSINVHLDIEEIFVDNTGS
ncbi:hypothetical protein BU17DRAFT_83570 [Hysterangium stoloniferum]|nr:hypothetical protein BU17DRAFT_83570 [Hysterangium stoloniferum]